MESQGLTLELHGKLGGMTISLKLENIDSGMLLNILGLYKPLYVQPEPIRSAEKITQDIATGLSHIP